MLGFKELLYYLKVICFLKDSNRPNHNVGVINLLRHAYVSTKLTKARTIKDRVKLAEDMRHSVKMSNEYINEIED